MLNSNQPYERVDDGIMNSGMVAGSMMGAIGAGSAQAFGEKGIDALNTRNDNLLGKRDIRNLDKRGPQNGEDPSKGFMKNLNRDKDKHTNASKSIGSLQDMHSSAFKGGWKGKAAAYGGSVIAGGLLGSGVDYLT